MASKGWICVHREVQDSWLWKCDPFSRGQAWIDLLLLVNHEDRKIMVNGKLQTIKRGQTLTSIYKLAERWQWSRGKTKRFLDALKMDNMITLECSLGGTTNGTTLTIVNYSKFQNQRATDDTTLDTTLGTTDDTTNGQKTILRSDTNNNYNNINNDNNDKQDAPPTSTFTPYKGGYGGPYKKTAFHNIEQHDYNFEALEQELLERGRKKLNE